IEVRANRLDALLPGMSTGDWIKSGTFHRRVALDVPALQYLAPGHVFVDALLHNAQNAHDARATAFFRDLGAKGRGRVFSIVVGRLGPDELALSGATTPGLLRRAEHYLPLEWVRSAFEILSDGHIVPVPEGMLLQMLTRDFQPTDRKCHPDHMS